MKNILLLILGCIGYNFCPAQKTAHEEMLEADSLERVLLKREIKISDEKIDSVFKIRATYMTAIHNFRKLGNQAYYVKGQLELFRNNRKDALVNLLGQRDYDAYIALIKRRTDKFSALKGSQGSPK